MESDQIDLVGQHLKHYTFMRVIDKGKQGVVFQALEDEGKNTVAIKVFIKKHLKNNPAQLEMLKNEIKILKKCKNDNIIRYIENFQSQEYFFIVTEYCNGGNLQKYIDKEGNLSEDQALMFLKQILNGFKGLHEIKTMHRDFKSENVLIHNNVCKIADLGFSKQLQKDSLTNTILGTAMTMAPQILDGKSYGFQADIWSIGVVFYQMLFGKYPFKGRNEFDLLKKIKTTTPEYESVLISKEARIFLQNCLKVDRSERIKWDKVYFDPLLLKEANMVYGLKYQIKIQDQQQFYTKTGLPEEDELQLDMIDAQFKEIDEEIKQSSKMQIYLQEIKEMKSKEKAFLQFQKLYLNKRNNIFFMFKFIAPYVSQFNFIKANHGVSLFIMSKKAYIEMKEFGFRMKKGQNIFKLEPSFFLQFVCSNEYKKIYDQIHDDIENIRVQALCYYSDIQMANDEITVEYDLQKIISKHFNILVYETVDEYWFLLVDNLGSIQNERRKDLINILQAIYYYKENKELDGEQFGKTISKINYEEAEKNIIQRYSSIFS